MPRTTAPPAPSDADRRLFLMLLPTLRDHARAAFRAVRCPHDREDAEAEVVLRAWEAFRPAARVVTAAGLAAPVIRAVRAELARRRPPVPGVP